jgi:hypothetical protein
MKNCEWEPIGDIFRCKNCQTIVKTNRLKRNCNINLDISTPGLVKRGVNLGKAVVKHAQGGFQHCTEEQKKARFAICQSNRCELFKVHGEGGICSHDDCGCYIRSNGKFMDKLSWAESKCPTGQWGSIEQEIPKSE